MEVWSEVSQDHTLIIHGRFITTDEEFFLFNVYSPCDIRAKHDLWVSLSTWLLRWRGKKVCARGDFNAVRRVEERRSAQRGGDTTNFAPFNNFIEENMLIDLLLCGLRFTWLRIYE
jgi:hypothetical protein